MESSGRERQLTATILVESPILIFSKADEGMPETDECTIQLLEQWCNLLVSQCRTFLQFIVYIRPELL